MTSAQPLWYLWRTMKIFALLFSFLFALSVVAEETDSTKPQITKCDISPKEIKYKTEVTISFEYEDVEGGLKEAKVTLNQKIQMPDEEKVVTRTSNWESLLTNLSEYKETSGRYEKKFVNSEYWRGPSIQLTYEFKITDKRGKESNICTTKISPK